MISFPFHFHNTETFVVLLVHKLDIFKCLHRYTFQKYLVIILQTNLQLLRRKEVQEYINNVAILYLKSRKQRRRVSLTQLYRIWKKTRNICVNKINFPCALKYQGVAKKLSEKNRKDNFWNSCLSSSPGCVPVDWIWSQVFSTQ